MKYLPAPAVSRLGEFSRVTSAIGPDDFVSLAIGDPDLPTPPVILEAGIAALRDGYTHYTDWNGDPDLRLRVAEVESARAFSAYAFENTVIGHGATGILYSAILALVGPGDRVVLPEPTYTLYADLVMLAGGLPVFVPLLPDHHLDLETLGEAMVGAKMVVLCSPGNPTGVVFTREEFVEVARLAERHKIWVLSDEAYSALVYDGVEFTSALEVPEFADRLIYCQTFSKSFAMTGWRVGYALASPEVAEAMRIMHRTINGPLNAAAQRAAIVALDNRHELAANMLASYTTRREYMHGRIAEIDGLEAAKPDGAFYVFARFNSDVDSFQMADRLTLAGVGVRAGREYGPTGERHLRLCFATDIARIAPAMDRIADVFSALAAR